MSAKKGKSAGKKSSEKKNNEVSLTSIFMRKHLREGGQGGQGDLASQTGQLLETILTGSDEELKQVIRQWSNFEAIEGVVRGWGSTNSILFFSRLTTALGISDCGWTYPWINSILATEIDVGAQSRQKWRLHVQKRRDQQLCQVIKFQGKLKIFDS